VNRIFVGRGRKDQATFRRMFFPAAKVSIKLERGNFPDRTGRSGSLDRIRSQGGTYFPRGLGLSSSSHLSNILHIEMDNK